MQPEAAADRLQSSHGEPRSEALVKCQKCGAEVAPGASNCGYCGAPTGYSHQAAWQAQQLQHYQAHQQHNVELHRDAARHQEAQASLKRTARHALIWSILGLVCCLIPFFGVVGVVMALRARKMAKKYQLVVPVHATLGLVIGAFAVVASVFMYVMIIVQEVRLSGRIEELERKVGGRDAAVVLSPQVACYLAEIRVLKDGIGGRSGSSIDDVECNGRLETTAERAILHDFSLRVDSSSGRHYLKACFSRGVRWSVTGFRKSADCEEADDTEALFRDTQRRDATGSATPSASGALPAAPTPASGGTSAGR